MSKIRGAGNKDTELRLIQIFRANGITGWRRGSKLPGKPDFVFPKLKTAVFVDGCFWHGCPKHGTKPRNRAAFWVAKLTGNKARDRRVNRTLRGHGWVVLRIWEHELKTQNVPRLLKRLQPLRRMSRNR
jgi:DNA mismatch endonuclease (patch repair protein)